MQSCGSAAMLVFKVHNKLLDWTMRCSISSVTAELEVEALVAPSKVELATPHLSFLSYSSFTARSRARLLSGHCAGWDENTFIIAHITHRKGLLSRQ